MLVPENKQLIAAWLDNCLEPFWAWILMGQRAHDCQLLCHQLGSCCSWQTRQNSREPTRTSSKHATDSLWLKERILDVAERLYTLCKRSKDDPIAVETWCGRYLYVKLSTCRVSAGNSSNRGVMAVIICVPAQQHPQLCIHTHTLIRTLSCML
jgi:hypothetical protein